MARSITLSHNEDSWGQGYCLSSRQDQTAGFNQSGRSLAGSHDGRRTHGSPPSTDPFQEGARRWRAFGSRESRVEGSPKQTGSWDGLWDGTCAGSLGVLESGKRLGGLELTRERGGTAASTSGRGGRGGLIAKISFVDLQIQVIPDEALLRTYGLRVYTDQQVTTNNAHSNIRGQGVTVRDGLDKTGPTAWLSKSVTDSGLGRQKKSDMSGICQVVSLVRDAGGGYGCPSIGQRTPPRWTLTLADGTELRQRVIAVHLGAPRTG
ncbi:hypothetical protein B0J13DRAFT_604440 [Dactylonectria estremocensis]|uniref:Uncharacterized protein n=1 Tax=Dactylonectria estremocensis TaxID=1079267 RepID=A0A9P9J7N6_9HYPO|nr:hypothetical protein B0J13DRAFT_604440 [Dactylonectria estremocensis]